MQDIQLSFLIFLLFCTSNLRAQQEYSGSSVWECKNTYNPPSSSYLYTCNGHNLSCHSFLMFNSRPGYNSVSSISKLLSSDLAELARINEVAESYSFPIGKEVIIPVNCACSGQYYMANTSHTLSDNDIYFTLANDTYQGLSSCSALIGENPFDAYDLYGGLEVLVPLRCACPTLNQTKSGVEYLLTYSVWEDDNIPDLSTRFNVSLQGTILANGFSGPDTTILQSTTILIPLPKEPLSNQTIIHRPIQYPPPPLPPQFANHETKRVDRVRLLVGIGVGVAFLLAVCAAIAIVFWQDKQKMKRAEVKKKCILPRDVLVTKADVDHDLKVFPFEEVKMATNDFSSDCRVGRAVYRGIVQGNVLAIKEMNKDVTSEVNMLHKLNHFNLISLCGVSMDQEHCYLLYEYMENGSLKDWLHDRNQLGQRSWLRRIQIALDIANGLNYLHNFAEPSYVHKDIKSSNILLNKNLRAKIANFSLARSSERRAGGYSITRNVEGTFGYMAPEYLESGLVTQKLDVYGFGVVLLELITGKDAIIMHERRERLLSAVIASIMEGTNAEDELSKFRDLAAGDCPIDIAIQVAKLSVSCLRQDPESRPTMDEILSSLSTIQRNS